MLAWLEAVGIKAILNWLFGKISAAIALFEKDKADQAAAVAQAKQDNQSSLAITKESKSDAIDKAIDDSFKHL